jgi:arylformamidase
VRSDAPLFSLLRTGVPEITVYGEVVVTQDRRVLFQTSDALGEYPARSLLKPFQFLATGLVEPDLKPWHVTAMGSVSATEEQVRTIRQWFENDRSILMELNKVPASFPMDEKNRVHLKESRQGPEQWYHTCLCKHAAILEACRKNNWPTDSYLESTHPFHQQLTQKLAQWLGSRDRSHVIDGCGLPSPVFVTSELATLFENLIRAAPNSAEWIVANAMMTNAEWIGGPKRVDTRHMLANPGRLVAKEGADGLWGLGAMAKGSVNGPVGILVKISAGFYPELAALAVAPILQALGLKPSADVPRGQEIRYHFEPMFRRRARTWDLSPVVNESIAVWPGDVGYERIVSLDTDTGNHLTRSAVKTTLHVGTHAEGLNHFEAKVSGIDQAVLDRYWGPCQVIRVEKAENTSITVSDIESRVLLAKRILFATGTFPDPIRFNEDFVSLSVELIEWLGERGVLLVGIDTPSIDPFSSKTLSAHKATTAFKMGILEGLVLTDVAEGVYDLSAIPLKWEKDDASPVRVALRELR